MLYKQKSLSSFKAGDGVSDNGFKYMKNGNKQFCSTRVNYIQAESTRVI